MTVTVNLQQEMFDAGALVNQFTRDLPEAGAVATFTGLVRSTPDKPIRALILEHHPTMAQKQIERFAQEATDRFDLLAIEVVHRFGEMQVGEPIVQVMAASHHRQSAFDGANYVMDWLKTDAPFWKKEVGPDGSYWVDARETDETAKEKWTK
ncbi:molybdenum cofactor biosynthesis protein MoaE [Maritalea mediterranea]|uniref:Molybdopterin synthase catalytic subunit n=1 Tax=Maritalea mediterranea TaxID=2909667 RepID=A0ABS9E842_9HYPH|nr:molybdenum cofactor biosynthesis protein MoaE [Maritalea mediterranea]MCF4099053.1 molybdenum cofactor biosynthesis protein MoaE [Maritalea mediterranea]